MKSLAVGLEDIAEWQPLREAWRKYRAGKRLRRAVAAFELDADRRLLHLARAILTGRYRHGPYRLKRIADPKPRLIAVAPVADRIVHTALHHALAPGFEKGFIFDSYACRPGRGQHRAVLRFLEFQRRFGHVMHLDIHRYYASLDHGILLGLLLPRLRDRRLGDLLAHILESGWALYRREMVRQFFGLEPLVKLTRPHGLPIGNLTSQWWGNVYLDGLDHFIKRNLKIKGYLRYMDDLVCFAESSRALDQARREIVQWLREHRRLELNPRKGDVRSTLLPQHYLGYRVTRAGIDVGPKSLRRLRRALPKLARGPLVGLRRSLVARRGAVLL